VLAEGDADLTEPLEPELNQVAGNVLPACEPDVAAEATHGEGAASAAPAEKWDNKVRCYCPSDTFGNEEWDNNTRPYCPSSSETGASDTFANQTDEAQSKKKRTLLVLRVALVALIVAALCGVAYLSYQFFHMAHVADEIAATPTPATVAEPKVDATDNTTAQETLPDNPIDFATLTSQNADIYAWLYVPNTNINLPILRSGIDDNYYLTHDKDGNSATEGAIFTQSMNATDFSDPVTVVYGHNMKNGSMFATLHYFENADFYAANPQFYVYTPGHILTYNVVSAYQYDDRHILNSFDFTDAGVLQTYFDSVCAPESLVTNVTEGANLDASTDKIVQLSTCVGGNYPNRRYIVTGVLASDQLTN
jgi:sortase B